jgi:hypothetical protein
LCLSARRPNGTEDSCFYDIWMLVPLCLSLRQTLFASNNREAVVLLAGGQRMRSQVLLMPKQSLIGRNWILEGRKRVSRQTIGTMKEGENTSALLAKRKAKYVPQSTVPHQ